MIAVAGFNSAIDRLIDIDALVPGQVIRAAGASAWPGGKGVHAAMCVATLGEAVQLVGLVDVQHQESFVGWLGARHVSVRCIAMPGSLRTCLAIRERDGRMTEILEPGPPIPADVCDGAIEEFVSTSRRCSIAILSGSLPRGMAADTYRRIISQLPDERVLVDASGEALRTSLDAAPFCIKPNRSEAEALTGITLDSPAAAARAARTLLSTGVRLVVVSLGAEGAVAATSKRACHVVPPPVAAVNAVGAGDCLIAGIAVGLTRGLDPIDAVSLGVASGTAKVLTAETGVVQREHIDTISRSVRITTLD